MDHWDPAVTDGFAKDREVILFNNAGVSSSSGEVPTRIEKMGAHAVAFIKALKLTKVDVLGFSIGGFVAQEIVIQAPDLVKRLVLVGTGPRSGEGMATLTPEAQEIFGATYDEPDHLWLRVHFTKSERSQAAGRKFLERFRLRAENRDPEVNEKVAPAQIEAIGEWGTPRDNPFEYLNSIRQPALVVNGGKDVIIYSVNSFILQQHLPNETHPTPPLLDETAKEKAQVSMWERRAELEGFAAVMEAIRNSVPGLKSRAIAGPHDYDQLPELAERSKLRVKNFFADFDDRLREAAFVAGQRFSVADVTVLVTVDFAAKAINYPVPDEHRSLKRWYDATSSRPSMAA
jgi:pimeloyl-ACP methyl ester carboxylesterase